MQLVSDGTLKVLELELGRKLLSLLIYWYLMSTQFRAQQYFQLNVNTYKNSNLSKTYLKQKIIMAYLKEDKQIRFVVFTNSILKQGYGIREKSSNLVPFHLLIAGILFVGGYNGRAIESVRELGAENFDKFWYFSEKSPNFVKVEAFIA